MLTEIIWPHNYSAAGQLLENGGREMDQSQQVIIRMTSDKGYNE